MPIKSVALIRQLVRGLRIASVVAAFVLTSSAYADPLYLFTLTLNHAPIYAPYGGDISSLSWTLPIPTTSSNPVGPGIGDQPTLQAQSLCSGGYCPSQDEVGYFMDPYFANLDTQIPPPQASSVSAGKTQATVSTF
ncbi:hypothetical protein [Granulicella sp. L60]|uniref:hypothetical protein n=1 Tax=Granulicella sp. L60 TaxID=1641866 RepID=UPI00131C22FA|nr:hypothetical protein [Granulicella sp. L60]